MTATPAITLTDLRGRLLTPAAARHEYEVAMTSLAHAEALEEMLAAHSLPGNDYYTDAMERATELAAEMAANMQYVMDNCTPESIGL